MAEQKKNDNPGIVEGPIDTENAKAENASPAEETRRSGAAGSTQQNPDVPEQPQVMEQPNPPGEPVRKENPDDGGGTGGDHE